MIMVARIDNKIVEIVKVQETVGFSHEKNWIYICGDFDKINRRREQFKWVQADSVRFDWVREFIDADPKTT